MFARMTGVRRTRFSSQGTYLVDCNRIGRFRVWFQSLRGWNLVNKIDVVTTHPDEFVVAWRCTFVSIVGEVNVNVAIVQCHHIAECFLGCFPVENFAGRSTQRALIDGQFAATIALLNTIARFISVRGEILGHDVPVVQWKCNLKYDLENGS